MKQVITAFVMIMVAGSMFWGVSKEVRAERREAPELAEKLAYSEDGEIYYDCGTSTVDGILQVHSDSHSLKEGDIVDVQVIYNGEKNKIGTFLGTTMDINYEKDILEYVGTTFEDDYARKYRPYTQHTDNDYGFEWICGAELITTENGESGFAENGCIATLHFKVKKEVKSVQLYFDYIYLCGKFWDNEDHYGVMYSCNLTMEKTETLQAWLESGFVLPNTSNALWEDVLTLNITDSSSGPAKEHTLILSTTPAQGSKEVTVPINIEKNDGFNLLGLTLDYDTSLFAYDSLEIDDSLKTKISLDSIYEAPGSGKVKASFIALEDITDVGNFLKLKLKVKDGVSAGTNSNVGVEVTQVGNKAETNMSGTGTTCAISITDDGSGEEQQPVLGDVNVDKKVDLVDAVYILQNYNQVREFTKVQETAADVDKNGAVNLLDALMIMKHFNGEIATL